MTPLWASTSPGRRTLLDLKRQKWTRAGFRPPKTPQEASKMLQEAAETAQDPPQGPSRRPSWGHLGPSWGHLGAILGASWPILAPRGRQDAPRGRRDCPRSPPQTLHHHLKREIWTHAGLRWPKTPPRRQRRLHDRPNCPPRPPKSPKTPSKNSQNVRKSSQDCLRVVIWPKSKPMLIGNQRGENRMKSGFHLNTI